MKTTKSDTSAVAVEATTLDKILSQDQLREAASIVDSTLDDARAKVQLVALLSPERNLLTRKGFPPEILANQLLAKRPELVKRLSKV